MSPLDVPIAIVGCTVCVLTIAVHLARAAWLDWRARDRRRPR